MPEAIPHLLRASSVKLGVTATLARQAICDSFAVSVCREEECATRDFGVPTRALTSTVGTPCCSACAMRAEARRGRGSSPTPARSQALPSRYRSKGVSLGLSGAQGAPLPC